MHLDILNKRLQKEIALLSVNGGENGCERNADPQTACDVLIQCYNAGAGAEALLRAFISERNCEPFRAQFWVGVYRLIVRRSRLAQESPDTF
jgi:hypothetical protein